MAQTRSRALLWILLTILFFLAILFGKRAFFSAQLLLQRTDLSISQQGPLEVSRGGTAVYTLSVRNAGPDAAANVVVSDVMPPGLRFEASASHPTCAVFDGIVFCGGWPQTQGFTLEKDEQREFPVAFTVPAAAGCRITLMNNVLVQSTGQRDAYEGDNRSMSTTTVVCDGR
ncbi:MAG: DUF11 domain-containing protein [Candidatus Peribacteraceae bacterium]|jgi:uncharacterized repeat protein (TIGR01451 family)